MRRIGGALTALESLNSIGKEDAASDARRTSVVNTDLLRHFWYLMTILGYSWTRKTGAVGAYAPGPVNTSWHKTSVQECRPQHHRRRAALCALQCQIYWDLRETMLVANLTAGCAHIV